MSVWATPPPAIVLINASLSNLEMHFIAFKLTDYAAVFNNDYAMPKHDYIFGKYGPNDIRQRARNWCDHFNDTHRALQKISEI
jgi:uncharacterized protein YutD